MAALDVWLYGSRLGQLSSPRAEKLRFVVDDDALSRWGIGATILSLALPLDNGAPAPSDKLRAFFNGLLPEGAARDSLIRRFNLRPRDILGLLEQLGEDCAGAVMALPPGRAASPSQSSYRRLSADDLVRLVANLATAPLGFDQHPVTRKSLAGVQPKLLLTRLKSGEWAQSTNGAPSTHILKPEELGYPGGASNEAWCMRLARACGLTTVEADVLDVDGTTVYVVSRYDRRSAESGVIERIHQEDSCQALGIETFSDRAKYGMYNPKRMTLRAISEQLRFRAPEQRERLLAYTTFHIAIGNADAHGKNHSILHHPDDTIELAPIYDAWSTIQYSRLSRTLSLSIDKTFQLDAVDRRRLVAEANSWGLSVELAQTIVDNTLARLLGVIDDDQLRNNLILSDVFIDGLRARVLKLKGAA